LGFGENIHGTKTTPPFEKTSPGLAIPPPVRWHTVCVKIMFRLKDSGEEDKITPGRENVELKRPCKSFIIIEPENDFFVRGWLNLAPYHQMAR